MRVAILSESERDEEAVRILINGILGRSTQGIAHPRLGSRGWSSIRDILSGALNYLHYQTDTEALVVVVDSDDSLVHQPSHNLQSGTYQECRLCQLRAVVANTQKQLRRITGRPPMIKVAIGLAVPAIEAWYRCGLDSHVTEAAWIQAQNQQIYPYTRSSLKADVYRTERPPQMLKTRRATEQAHRLVEDLSCLERWFPNGFGPLMAEVRTW